MTISRRRAMKRFGNCSSKRLVRGKPRIHPLAPAKPSLDSPTCNRTQLKHPGNAVSKFHLLAWPEISCYLATHEGSYCSRMAAVAAGSAHETGLLLALCRTRNLERYCWTY